MRSFTLVFLVPMALSCSDQEFSTIDGNSGVNGPEILVDPTYIDFGEARQDDALVRSFTVTNVGEDDLEVSSIEIGISEGAFTIINDNLDFVLPTSASELIELVYTPTGAGEQTAQALVHSNDPDDAHVAVDLVGTGLVPDIAIDPNPYDFGDVYIMCPREGQLDIINVGDEPVEVSDLSFSGAGFTLIDAPATPFVLSENGEYESVTIEFDPSEEMSYAGALTVISDAPGSPDIGDVTGTGHYVGDYTDVWDIPEEPPVDLLWVVDQSGSMDDDQTSLANNFEGFVNQLSAYTNDWQMMVVNYYDGCNGSGILTPSTSNYKTIFAQAVKQGDDNSWNNGEMGLYVADKGVQNTDGGECNSGFMRSDALLHVIIVSDERDQSPGDWDYYVTRMQSKKGDPNNVKISAVAGDYPGGCGSAEAGIGYYEAVTATDGVFLSICSNWSNNVEDLADASVALSEYELSRTPDPDTIVVEVNGSTRSSWHFDEASNSVVFDNNVPEGGDYVEITYSYVPECD